MCILLLAGLVAAQTKSNAKAAPRTPGPAPEQFQIAGRVVDAATGQPLAEAEVGLGISGKPEIIDGVLTDSDGRFVFRNLAAGKYWITAEKSPRFPRQPYGERERFFIGIAVGPKLTTEEVEFRLKPGASIEGTVTDEQGDPVRNAQVMLFYTVLISGKRLTGFVHDVRTDDQGHYLFSHLKPGTCFVAVYAQPWYAEDQVVLDRGPRVHDDDVTVPRTFVRALPPPPEHGGPEDHSAIDVVYPITYFANATDPVSATSIDLKGGDRATADLVLMPVAPAHFKLKCAVGCGQEGSVEVLQPTFGDHNVTVGRLSFGGATPDGEAAVAAPPGPAMISLSGGAKELPIEATEGAEIDVRVATDAAHVRAQVSMEDGSKAKGVNVIQYVSLESGHLTAGRASEGAQNDPVNLKAGHYAVFAPNNDDAMVRSISATGARVSGHTIEVAEGAQVQLEITLTKGTVDLTGIALRADKPMAGAMVLLLPEDVEHNEALIRRDESDSDGSFLLRATLPGKYTLVAIDDGWDLEWRRPEVLAPYLKAGQTVVVKSDGKYDLKVVVQSVSSVESSILEANHPKP